MPCCASRKAKAFTTSSRLATVPVGSCLHQCGLSVDSNLQLKESSPEPWLLLLDLLLSLPERRLAQSWYAEHNHRTSCGRNEVSGKSDCSLCRIVEPEHV